MDPIEKFNAEKAENITKLGQDQKVKDLALNFMVNVAKHNYTYNFTWLGRPIIQYPQDMIALQEIIWNVKPDLIIETGIAHGGSLIFNASILRLLSNNGKVLGIDIDIRDHNRKAIEDHPLSNDITMFEGSSTDDEMIRKVKSFAKDYETILVILDSNHTHEHVLNELKAYSDLVTKNSYLIVFDTGVEDFPEDYDWGIRTWNKKDNPKTAVREFLSSNDNFKVDKVMDNKLMISVAPEGFLKRVK